MANQSSSSLLNTAQGILKMFETKGFIAVLAGGCVRDRLLGQTPKDYDIATSASPEQSSEVALRMGWKAIPTGISHGTVTLVKDGFSFEVTSLRRDLETDGRHAKVSFENATLEEDAKRRDFTVNALFEDASGQVLDFVGGLSDLQSRTLRFVGDAETRIDEDVLRILRFYRFWSRLQFQADEASRNACRIKAKHLPKVSRERIDHEFWGILSGRGAPTCVRAAFDDGILQQILDVPLSLTPESWVQIEELARQQRLRPVNTASGSSDLYYAWENLLLLLGLTTGQELTKTQTSKFSDALKWSQQKRTHLERLCVGWNELKSLGTKPSAQMDFLDAAEGLNRGTKNDTQVTFIPFFAEIWTSLAQVSNDQYRLDVLAQLKTLESSPENRRHLPLPVDGDDILQMRPDIKGVSIAKAKKQLLDEFRDGLWTTRDEGLRRLESLS